MKGREQIEEFLKDLSLTVPYIQDYKNIDWIVLLAYTIVLILMIKNRGHGLFLLSILYLLCWTYGLLIGECNQNMLFLFYFLVTAWSCHAIRNEKAQ